MIESVHSLTGAPTVLECSGLYGLSLEGDSIYVKGLVLQRARTTDQKINTVALRAVAARAHVVDCAFLGFGDAAAGKVQARTRPVQSAQLSNFTILD